MILQKSRHKRVFKYVSSSILGFDARLPPISPGPRYFLDHQQTILVDSLILLLFMGVPGLWEAIGKAGQSRSLAHLAVVDGFEANKSGKRAYRIGIDASIW